MAKAKKQNGKITIEHLARMSQQEFSGISERFDKVDKRFDAMEDKMDAGFGMLAEVLKAMREDLNDVKENTFTTNEDYKELRARIERLEKRAGLSR